MLSSPFSLLSTNKMRFVCGSPTLLAPCFADERDAILQAAFHPQGAPLMALLTVSTIQLWGGAQHTTHLCTMPLPHCAAGPRGADAAVSMTWSPSGQRIAIGTVRRRVLILEQDVLVRSNEDTVQLDATRNALLLTGAASRLAVSSETQLDHGLITSVHSTSEATLLVTTVGGYAVLVRWATGECVSAIRSSSLIQQLVPPTGEQTSSVTGSLLDVSLAPAQRLMAAVFSDGSFAVADIGDGRGLIEDIQSCATQASVGVERVFISPVEPVVVTVSNGNVLRLWVFHAGSILLPMESLAPWRDQVGGLGRVASVAWSPEGGTFAVAFAAAGAAVFHATGMCLWASFPRLEGGLLPPNSRPLVPHGCRAVAIGAFGSTLVGVDSTGHQMFTLGLSKPIRAEMGSCTALASSTGVSLLRYGEGPGHLWETHPLPSAYLRAHFPIRFGAASPCGELIFVATTRGAAVFNTRTCSWSELPVGDERALEVVADPCWVNSCVVAVPVVMRGERAFAVILFQRGHIQLDSALSTIRLPRRPTHLSVTSAAGESLLTVVDTTNTVRTWWLSTKVDGQIAPRRVLLGVAEGPSAVIPDNIAVASLTVYPINARGESVVGVLRGRDGVMWSVRLGGDDPLNITPFPQWAPGRKRVGGTHEFAYECPGLPSSGGGHRQGSPLQLLAASTRGVRLVTMTTVGTCSEGPVVCGYDGEVLFLGALPRDGLVLLAGEGIARPALTPGMHIPHEVSIRAEVLNHITLLSLLTQSDANALHQHIHRMREAGTFAAVIDYLLYYVIVDGDQLLPMDSSRVLSTAITCLRRYPEYYEVITGCVRKIDVSMWRRVFDVIGPPLGFFEECVRSGRVLEGAHIVRVILMSSPDDPACALDSTLACGVRLFSQALDSHDQGLAYELMRFLTLLCTEVDLPPLEEAKPPSIHDILRTHLTLGNHHRAPPTTVVPNNERPIPTALIRPVFYGRSSNAPEQDAADATLRVLQRPELVSLGARLQEYAVALYTSGRAVALCSFFELFSLDLCFFLEHIGQYLDATGRSLSLTTLFALMHVDLGLPRGRLSCPLTNAITTSTTAVAPHNATQQAYTTTQDYLFKIPTLVQALGSLATLFHSFGCLEYVVAIHVLLGQMGLAEQVARRATHQRGHLLHQALESMLGEKANAGYMAMTTHHL